MRLDEAPIGVAARVIASHATACLAPALRRRLAELGVREGEEITPLHRTSGGGRVVAVGHTRIALAISVLRAIEVDPT